MVRLHVRDDSGTPIGDADPCVSPGSHAQVSGLRELGVYVLEVKDAGRGDLFIDDVACDRFHNQDSTFRWEAGFYAGSVWATFVRSDGASDRFRLVVAPDASKATEALYERMLDEIGRFDAELLIGQAPAQSAMHASENPLRARREATVRFERLRAHGSEFLAATRAAVRSAHRSLSVTHEPARLDRIRRMRPAALRDPRVAAALLPEHMALTVDEVDKPFVRSAVTRVTADTPANATLKALLLRFKASIEGAQRDVRARGLLGEPGEQDARKCYRLSLLQSLHRQSEDLVRRFPFAEVARSASSSAGLTQIAALPPYSRAYRLGALALRTGVGGDGPANELPLPPSYGVYETWCFVALAKRLAETLNVASWQRASGSAAAFEGRKAISADVALYADLPEGGRLWLLYQPTFLSVRSAVAESAATTVSGERRPDIVVLITGPRIVFVPLDAKYRAGPENVLAGMESAHIYRDSLRVRASRATIALILFPGAPCVPPLHQRSTWLSEGVGAIAETRPGGSGIEQLVHLLQTELRLPAMPARAG